MRSIGRYFASVLWQLKEQQRVKKRFYGNAKLCQTDRALAKAYLGRNPFHISKRFLQQKGAASVYAYGETPLTTLAQIAEECGITAQDHVMELGCGRGRGAFFLSNHTGCKVLGIDWIPEFVNTANEISKQLQLSKVRFACTDMFSADFTKATAIYLYGTCLEDAEIELLQTQFQRLRRGTKIITVSYPLEGNFGLRKEFTAAYPWGETEVFLNEVL
jgi:cyclopropane fatty-acyl-phospholipid synthase-like methyltransferase